MQELKLELAAEYMLMAATLAEIKSKLLYMEKLIVLIQNIIILLRSIKQCLTRPAVTDSAPAEEEPPTAAQH